MRIHHSGNGASIDMLDNKGLTRKLIQFALPLIASGLVQQSFNSVDVAVVGRFVGSHALAAVGANGPVIALIINLFMGIAVGANVVIATYLGQKDQESVSKAVASTGFLAVICGTLLLVVGLIVSEPILRLLGTPESVIDDAVIYLRIYSLGFPAMLIYNFGSAVLRSIGDTKRPFYCLVAGGLVNVALNLVLVLVFNMGVSGVAVATIVSNIISAIMVVIILRHENGAIKLHLNRMKPHATQTKKILRIGLPAGIQGMVFAFSNVFIQSAVNSFGQDSVAGSAAALNYEQYCYFIIVAFTQATMAFTSQNYGARQYRMCRKIYWRCMALSLASCGSINILIALFPNPFIYLFTTNSEAIQYATIRISTVLAFQFIACSYEISGAAMRALGYSMTPTIITIFGTCLLRICWVHSLPDNIENARDLFIIYPITWIATGTLALIAYSIISRHCYSNNRSGIN